MTNQSSTSALLPTGRPRIDHLEMSRIVKRFPGVLANDGATIPAGNYTFSLTDMGAFGGAPTFTPARRSAAPRAASNLSRLVQRSPVGRWTRRAFSTCRRSPSPNRSKGLASRSASNPSLVTEKASFSGRSTRISRYPKSVAAKIFDTSPHAPLPFSMSP